MTAKNILAGLGFVVLFFVVVNIIPKSNKVYYEFQKYQKTIDSPISGPVTRIIHGKNLFGVQIGADPNNYYGFTYQTERTPKQLIDRYPKDFILMGDSIKKKAGSDTFIVVRGSLEWIYLLSKDPTTTK